MGFTSFEKNYISNFLRGFDDVEFLKNRDLPEEIQLFLKNKDLWHNLRDYSIVPKKYLHRLNKAENIVISKFYNAEMNIHDEVTKLLDTLTPTFRLQIDFGLIIISGETKETVEYQYVWPQRSLTFNKKIHINSLKDCEESLDEFKGVSRAELTRKIFNNHQNQAIFEKSGFRPLCLLNVAFFLAKI